LIKRTSFHQVHKFFSVKTTSFVDKAKLTEHTFMIVVAILIGTLAGFAAIGIRAMIKGISYLSFPGTGNILENIIHSPWYIVLLAPIIGGLLVGPIIYFFAPEAKGHGVPEVMQAILQKGGKIRPRVAVIKAIASAITIGSGGSVGREGPIIQIGSSLGSMAGQFFNIPSKRLKTLVGCGAAAGIAAAFNAPIAGALFAVEIILMDFAVAQFSPIVISSVMATVISRSFEGDFAAFQVPKYQLASPYELVFYLILGVGCGLASFAFIKSLYYCEEYYEKKLKIPEYLKPFTGGIGIGLIGLLFPQIMGVGYDSINNALHGNVIWYFAFTLVFIKILATSLTLGSGGSGGIFAPSLFMGAMLGEFFGSFVHSTFPGTTGTPGAYALVAMGGMVAGTTRAPITAIIIVFELTNDYRIILPLMITCIISMIVSTKLSRESIYTLKLLLRNIGIREGVETNAMESIFVKDIYIRDFDFINITDNFNHVVNKVIKGRGPEFPVLNSNGNIVGIISLYDIKEILLDKDLLKYLLIAEDLLNHNFEILHIDDNCQTALDKMSKYDLEGLPVTENIISKKILGMLWRKDIQDAYQKEIERREISVNLASSIQMKDEETQFHFMEGYSITEISPPKSFIGKSIRELDVRAKYGVDVLSIKIHDKQGTKIKAIPDPSHIFKIDDTMVVAGEIRNINVLINL
jgi:CIC family chloride channel protein